MRLVAACVPGLDAVGAGLLISNVALFGALLILYRLTAGDDGDSRGHEAGLAACAALLLFPMSLFLSAVYAESLFLLLALAAFAWSARGSLAAAGAAAGLAALTRPFGVMLALPLLLEWWSLRHRAETSIPGGSRPAAWTFCFALAPPACLGLFMLYCGRTFSDPMAFFHRQARWR